MRKGKSRLGAGRHWVLTQQGQSGRWQVRLGDQMTKFEVRSLGGPNIRVVLKRRKG